MALQGFDHLTFNFNREILLSVVLPSLKGIAEFFMGGLQIFSLIDLSGQCDSGYDDLLHLHSPF